ncbi:hypothetical protein [Aureimonas ureilytica]|uniref:hypothetical protein n=1 Tax=Aureimonas ureilytica TaxID=401562 RepID=UPI0012DE1232|nr:hypothetical protein [Aureimonas ureilytica]
MTDREVAILRRPEGDPEAGADWRSSLNLTSSGWLLIAMRNGLWYSVEYTGTLEQADNLARELAAPNRSSHEMRTSFVLRPVNLTAELVEATGIAVLDVPLLKVEWVPDDSIFVVGNHHRLTLNAAVAVQTDAAEWRRNERRGRESAYHAAVLEDRDTRMRKACRDTSEPLAPRY